MSPDLHKMKLSHFVCHFLPILDISLHSFMLFVPDLRLSLQKVSFASFLNRNLNRVALCCLLQKLEELLLDIILTRVLNVHQ